MDRKYVTLKPAPPSGAVASEGASSSGGSKRRRTSVAVACNSCRQRRSRCDGQRPCCRTCSNLKRECVYERKGSRNGRLGNGNNSDDDGALIEAVQLLNAMEPQQATLILKSLKDIKHTPTLLERLRNGVTQLPYQPSANASVDGIFPLSDLDVELNSRHSFLYPFLAPVDVAAQDSKFRKLVESGRGTTAGPTPSPAPQNTSRQPRTPPGASAPRISPLESLHGLRIAKWTNVNVSDDFASQAISLYLTTDHPLLGPFQVAPFLRTLVTLEGKHCSPLLVNSLMYWACQLYSTLDPEASNLVDKFCVEAERLWDIERVIPSALNMAAAQFLSFGYLVQGKDQAMLMYVSEATRMGVYLGMFGVVPDAAGTQAGKMSEEDAVADAYSTWGTFNWLTLMGLFYHQPGMEHPSHPPSTPIPQKRADVDELPQPGRSSSDWFVDRSFPVMCQFWRIMHDVVREYYDKGTAALPGRVPLSFAEYKFRELLAWVHSLPPALARRESSPYHVVIFHLWLHAAILDIFRPFIQDESRYCHLKTFTHSASTPDAVYSASVKQLKRLVVVYRSRYASSGYTIIWHTALLYIANAVLHRQDDTDWFFYFTLCLYGYEDLQSSCPVTEVIGRALLSLAKRNGDMSGDTARQVLADLQGRGHPQPPSSEIRATLMTDLDLVLSEPSDATAEKIADMFEDNAMMTDFTNIFQ